jgi:hypothetical protein
MDTPETPYFRLDQMCISLVVINVYQIMQTTGHIHIHRQKTIFHLLQELQIVTHPCNCAFLQCSFGYVRCTLGCGLVYWMFLPSIPCCANLPEYITRCLSVGYIYNMYQLLTGLPPCWRITYSASFEQLGSSAISSTCFISFRRQV